MNSLLEPSADPHTQLADVQAQITRYSAERDPQRHAVISQALSRLCADTATLDEGMQVALKQLMIQSGTIEPVWGLMAGLRLWQSGHHEPHDFSNVWNCARYAGIQSRYSALSAQTHLANVTSLYGGQNGLHHAGNPASFIIAGNACRQLHRYADAESAYLQGLDACPDNPFLKFRLVDLWLMTHQHDRARQMLASLRSRYPYAREMMFALPVADDAAGPQEVLPELSAVGRDYVWMVAADPLYVQRYGARLAQSIAARQPAGESRVHLHLHVVNEPEQAAPAAALQAVAALLPAHVTQRSLDLSGASADQRSAVFASERFLFLAEMLAKYDKPMLVSDIDVECLQDPMPLFERMGDADIGYTRFQTVRDAWDRYPATVLLVKPGAAGITFFKRLAGIIITLLNTHPQPWFVDQIALFRLIEGGLTPAKFAYLEHILTDSDSPKAFFRILHASWETE